MQRIGGRALTGRAIIEMTMLHVNGLPSSDLGSELVKKLPNQFPGRSVLENSIRVRRAVWGSQAATGKEYPTLSNCSTLAGPTGH